MKYLSMQRVFLPILTMVKDSYSQALSEQAKAQLYKSSTGI